MWSRTKYGSTGVGSESKRKLGGKVDAAAVAVVVVVVVGSGIPSLENRPFPEMFSVLKVLWEVGVCKEIRRGSNGSVNGEAADRMG